MNIGRRTFLGSAIGVTAAAALAPATALASGPTASAAIADWYRVILLLVRHTATYSPPVASRAFAYLGVAVWEAVGQGAPGARSLAGQLNGLAPLPARQAGATYDEAAIVNAALQAMVEGLFANTGPTGQRVMERMAQGMAEKLAAGAEAATLDRSLAHGRAIAAHVLQWSQGDGGAIVENLGFPTAYELKAGPAHWVPTSLAGIQQTPLLPQWGANRPFAMPKGNSCPLPPPPDYSEDPNSQFHREAVEVVETVRKLTDEQRAIARFWSDDPMLSPTPPGHWISIALQILEERNADALARADTLARLGVAMADAFIACWHTKFEFDLLRPVTYIRRVIDASFEPPLITPPFPEYPSGHSTQSGAAAEVLTALFGGNYAFSDTTHVREKMPARPFASFRAAAAEAAISRLYGGIHFRAAIDRGLEQGRCIGAHANALLTAAAR